MNVARLASALRARAIALRERDETRAGRDDAELICVLARMVEGKSVASACGAPGDWGYGTPVGDALFAAAAVQQQQEGGAA